MNEELLKRKTLEVLRTSLPLRSRSICYRTVYIVKIKGFESSEQNLSFEHSAILIGNYFYFVNKVPSCAFDQQALEDRIGIGSLLVNDIIVLNKKEIGITMFEHSEILFAGNFILNRLCDNEGKILEIFLFVICDVLTLQGESMSIENFLHQVRRVAEPKFLTKNYYCTIL